MLAVNHFYYETANVFDGSFKIFNTKSTDEYIELFGKYYSSLWD